MPSFAHVVSTTFITIIAAGSFLGLAGPHITAADAAGPRILPAIEATVLHDFPALAAAKGRVDSTANAYKTAAAAKSKIDYSDAAAAAAEDRPIKGAAIVDLSKCGGSAIVEASAMLVEAGGTALVCSQG